MPSRPGSFGRGYFLKWSETARLGPMPSGSSAAISAGVNPYRPAGIACASVNPRTVPPGHADGTAQVYTRTPSRRLEDGTARSSGSSLSSLSPSKFPKKKKRSFLIGPPRAPPKLCLFNFGAWLGNPCASWDRFWKYSLLDQSVFRCDQYPAPLKSLVPLLVTIDTCAALERPMSAV